MPVRNRAQDADWLAFAITLACWLVTMAVLIGALSVILKAF